MKERLKKTSEKLIILNVRTPGDSNNLQVSGIDFTKKIGINNTCYLFQDRKKILDVPFVYYLVFDPKYLVPIV